MPVLTFEEMVSQVMEETQVSRYEAAERLRAAAQNVLDAERQSRIAELRKRIDERKDAEKELAALRPVGAPRKPRVKRGALTPTPKAEKETA